MKKVISDRYYPEYNGIQSTRWSYRSYRIVGMSYVCKYSQYPVGYCDDEVRKGWVYGPRGARATRTERELRNVPGFRPLDE